MPLRPVFFCPGGGGHKTAPDEAGVWKPMITPSRSLAGIPL